MILEVNPDQVTLVPDGPDVITSCAGWDTIKFQSYLKEIISIFKERNIRTSIFVDPLEIMIEGAKKCGAEIPFMRPNELSGDHVGTNDVMAHAVKFIMPDSPNLTAVCCVYPTVPLLMKEDLIKGFQLFNSGKWQFVFSATKYSYPVFRSFTKNEKGSLKMLYPQHWNSNSQDLEEVMHDAGQFYWGSPKAWLNKELCYNENTTVIELPNWRVQDINTLEDWHQAEKKYEILNK